MSFIINVTSNGTYDIPDNDLAKLRGGSLLVKVAGVTDPLDIDGAIVEPRVDFYDNLFVPALAVDGSTVRQIQRTGIVPLAPLKNGTRLQFVVTSYSVPFTIKGLS